MENGFSIQSVQREQSGLQLAISFGRIRSEKKEQAEKAEKENRKKDWIGEKMKKISISIMGFFILLMCIALMNSTKANAETLGTSYSKHIDLGFTLDFYDYGPFKQDMKLHIKYTSTKETELTYWISGDYEKKRIIYTTDYEGDILVKKGDYLTIEHSNSTSVVDENYIRGTSYYYDYTLTVTDITDYSANVLTPTKPKTQVKIKLNKKSKKLTVGDVFDLKASVTGVAGYKLHWKSSNNKVAYVEDDGKKATVWTNKPGKCKITCYYKNAKATCTVKVDWNKQLEIYSLDWGYNTRSNRFWVVIKNNSKKPVTILKKVGMALDEDYTAYDRKIMPTSNVKIKSGKKKKVWFRVLGPLTWYKASDFTFYFSAKYKGKTRSIKVNQDVAYVKKNGKWKQF